MSIILLDFCSRDWNKSFLFWKSQRCKVSGLYNQFDLDQASGQNGWGVVIKTWTYTAAICSLTDLTTTFIATHCFLIDIRGIVIMHFSTRLDLRPLFLTSVSRH